MLTLRYLVLVDERSSYSLAEITLGYERFVSHNVPKQIGCFPQIRIDQKYKVSASFVSRNMSQ